ncbi:hypothetical protein EV143_104102 [Flavobacterium chryseum]|uniref:hypothetical protein n=1 Tax=Flavobacterium sp. P3160 TaxID=2512113 RepID=UPI00105CA091|nr:hypothetical protein [Flavobacterium sp. P3160]TDO77339.1 hypothetical protein EV143_104102 [Flavobacterium sp. P3160]
METLQEILKENATLKTLGTPAEYDVYAEYMSNIIKQLPNPGKLKLLTNTSSAQASFYFLDDATSAVNSTLYNNVLNQRIEGEGTLNGVDQVALTQDAFTNSYLSVYTKLRYQLSPNDKATQQKINADVASTVRALIPQWNAWYDAIEPKDVKKLNATNTDIALIQMTNTLNTVWLNPEFAETIQKDSAFPYTHLNDFKNIYNKIPVSVSKPMRDSMIEVFNKSGAAGAITADIANATQTLAGIIDNVQKPTLGDSGNGGMAITGSEKAIPGLVFEPARPNALLDQLSTYPPSSVFKISRRVTKSTETTLKVDASVGGGISIPILSFFSVGVSGGAKTSIFERDYSGSDYKVEVVVNNATLSPLMSSSPKLYNISTQQGWMSTAPVKDAIKNGFPAPTGVTGYVFNSEPNFNFNQGADFGYVNSLVFSQFLEIAISFDKCDSKQVRKYFEEHTDTGVYFLGIRLGGASQSVSYSYSFSDESATSIKVTVKPVAPGYVPGTDSVNQSLSQLVAVGVEYPFA